MAEQASLLNQDVLKLFLVFFVPGFISLKVFDLLVPSPTRDFSKSFVDAMSYSCLNFAILYWPISLLTAGDVVSTYPVAYYFGFFGILFIAPVAWPLVFLSVAKLPVLRGRIVDPLPKPWDFFFRHNEPCWVIVHLRDGRKIGGRFSKESFASSFPAPEQLYLQEVWRLDEYCRFTEKVDGTKGILISSSEFEALEFMKGEPGDAK